MQRKKHGGSATTGNKYGIYQMASPYEYVAGIWNTRNSYNANIYNATAKYKNVYTAVAPIVGDATIETRKWCGAIFNGFVYSSCPVFVRSVEGLFSYDYCDGRAYNYIASRAAVVCGEGF